MKKIKFLLMILFLAASTAVFAQPVISFNHEIFDFGDIYEGNVVTHDYVVKNTGTRLLKLEKIRASCGCTAAAPGKRELEPGDSTTVTVKFNSKGRLGVQKKYVYFFTNDPKHPQSRISFTTNVLHEGQISSPKKEGPSLLLSTTVHDFGEMKEGDTADFEVSLRNTGTELLKIDNIKTSCGCTAALLSSKELKPGEEGTLKIEFDSTHKSGRLTRTVTLYTNDPVKSDRTIVIYADVKKG